MPIDRKTLLVLPLIGMLAGCEQDMEGVKSASHFGDANRMTTAAMIIDPDPQYSEPMQTSGEQAAQASERVRTDKVKKPERVRSTQNIGGGSGS